MTNYIESQSESELESELELGTDNFDNKINEIRKLVNEDLNFDNFDNFDSEIVDNVLDLGGNSRSFAQLQRKIIYMNQISIFNMFLFIMFSYGYIFLKN
jgi:hypothetical protein